MKKTLIAALLGFSALAPSSALFLADVNDPMRNKRPRKRNSDRSRESNGSDDESYSDRNHQHRVHKLGRIHTRDQPRGTSSAHNEGAVRIDEEDAVTRRTYRVASVVPRLRSGLPPHVPDE